MLAMEVQNGGSELLELESMNGKYCTCNVDFLQGLMTTLEIVREQYIGVLIE